MTVKMIALDLDDTLLRGDKSISEYTLSVLERCRQKGIKIAIATARSESASKRCIDEINPDIVISSAGSLVRYGEEIVHKCMMSVETSNGIVADIMGAKEFISTSVEAETGFYATWKEASSPDYAHAVCYDFEVPLSEETYKIDAQLSSEAFAKEVAAKYQDCALTGFSGENWYRFASKSSGKMSGIKAIAKFLELDVSEIASFGDDFSDIEMIKHCGHGVAMGNAIAQVKAVARHTCDTNENDGVAKWLEQNAL